MEGAEVELVRLEELRIPSGPDAPEPDDAWWLWDKLVECDALIVSTPIISRTVAARLKLVADRLLGPNADAAIIEALVAAKQAGQDPGVPFRVDERVLKPRVAGFIAVGGSLTSQWKTLALPILHTVTFSMHMAVVDQVQFEGAGTPRRSCSSPRRSRGRRSSAATWRRRSAARSRTPSTAARTGCARAATLTSSRCAAATSSARRAAPAACSRAAACAGPTSTPR